MSDLPKQELDELFREGAGMQTFDYNEAAWDKMETKLDNDDRNRKLGMWLLLLVGVALAVMAGLYYTSLEESSQSPKEILYANESTQAQSSSTLNQTVESEIKTASETEVEDKIVVDQYESINNAIENINYKRVVEKNAKLNAVDDVNKFTQDATENAIAVKETEVILENPKLSNEFTNNNFVSATTSKTEKEKQTNEIVAKDLISIQDLQRSNVIPFTMNENWLVNSQTLLQLEDLLYEEEDARPSIASKFSYSIFAAPEWSAVGTDGPKERGYKFGAKVGFQIANHWELSTGLSLSQKKFNGKGSQFTISEGWVDDIMPMTMAGKCNIFEIPLDVVYHFNGVGESGIFASAGLRAYMIHSEWYGFEYAPFYDDKDDLIREKVMDNENKNWLGSIELSVGYNKKVDNNLSVQVAPYLQIPATGFGDGKVNLYSGGVQFAVRFDSE